MKTTVIYHSADFDGLFCREIARKFLGASRTGDDAGDSADVEFIGWDFGEAKIPVPLEGKIYILDLSPDCLDMPYGELLQAIWARIIWIDHHQTSIEKYASALTAGYRINGVSACRLTWQWFALFAESIGIVAQAPDQAPMPLPGLQDFIDRKVDEPLAVRLAGEYDVWDHEKSGGEDIIFQFGLRSFDLDANVWGALLETLREPGVKPWGERIVDDMLAAGRISQRYAKDADANTLNARSFLVEFEGLKFLALNTARCNSLTFAAKDVPETGHDALMGFFFNGKIWKFSLYGARHNPDLDLSAIASRFGGGGHKQACGFEWPEIGFETGFLKLKPKQSPAPIAPPIDNAHVAEGAEKFSEPAATEPAAAN